MVWVSPWINKEKFMKKVLTGALIAGAVVVGAAGSASAHDVWADGETYRSPGVGSGNSVQIPVHVPVNVTGNSVNGAGVGNHTHDNISENY